MSLTLAGCPLILWGRRMSILTQWTSSVLQPLTSLAKHTTPTEWCRCVDVKVYALKNCGFVVVVRKSRSIQSCCCCCCCCYYYYYYYIRLTAFFHTTWASRHQQKGKPFWILLEQEMMGWQWHQLDHMQIICTSLQTDNHDSTSPLSFYRPDVLPAAQQIVSKH